MNNKHVTRFGNPSSNTGALYHVSDQEGLVQMALDLQLAQLSIAGFVITPNDISNLASQIRFYQSNYNQIVSKMGIPSELNNLFESTNKVEVTKLCRELHIDEYDLYLLINNCSAINFTHRSKFPDYVPNGLEINETDKDKLKKGNPRPISKKLKSIFLQRRHLHVHLFQNSSKWHCFYFSYEDIQDVGQNHWKFGPHLHYVNYLWPNVTMHQIWETFNRRRTDIPGDIHIKFKPFKFPQVGDYSSGLPFHQSEQHPGYFAFSSHLATNRKSIPTPVAQIATRGSWVTEVFIPVK